MDPIVIFTRVIEAAVLFYDHVERVKANQVQSKRLAERVQQIILARELLVTKVTSFQY